MLILHLILLPACHPNGDDTSEIENEWGFSMRIPQPHELQCPEGARTEYDADWLCTFAHDQTDGVTYIQSTPTGCVSVGMSDSPTFESPLGQLATGGGIETLSDGLYDWGGNHHNDTLQFELGGLTYRFDHSSLGFGGRSCQDMDCIVVRDGTEIVEDGCTCDRTLPAACSLVTPEGTWEPLVDDFAVCLGDSLCGT